MTFGQYSLAALDSFWKPSPIFLPDKMLDGPPSRMTSIAVSSSPTSYLGLTSSQENYLGHSVNAPVGRWQKNKDIHWYQREVAPDADRADRERKEEIKRLKQAEEDALALALGLVPKKRDEDGEGSGANSVPVKGAEDDEKELRRREKE